MKIETFVEHSSVVTVDIGTEDIRAAIGESLGSRNPHDINGAFNTIAQFLNAFTDEQIAALSPKICEMVQSFLARTAERFSKASGTHAAAGEATELNEPEK